ncbi:MAG: UvrD-helicase domain-containing protein [Bacteroidota bacterium]|nr:UvrD-helicase domain-containing protein [Bacteroidota bacterium]
MSQLKIYKASAGSGKTFRLTGEYLKLLFEKNGEYYSNNRFQHILAVTFTNKATAEMKRRIIEELSHLARGEKSPYLDDLISLTGETPAHIQKKANFILNSILHTYSRFSVGTIDSFFQKILRSFIRELGLPAGFDIELDSQKVLEESVDRLLFNLEENKQLKNWLTNFAEDKIEDGRSWNFRNDLLSLGKEVFTEDFQSLDNDTLSKLSNEDGQLLSRYVAMLQKVRHDFENDLQQTGSEGLKIIADAGLKIEDFKGGTRSFIKHFQYLKEKKKFEPTPTTIKSADDLEQWYKKDSPKKDIIIGAYHAGLGKKLIDAINYYREHNPFYVSALEILKFIHTLGILSDIDREMHSYCNDQNIFMLNEAAGLLRNIIDESDTPFLYEKTGSFYQHFMIDEFQDTSNIQWVDFKPLIANSLSDGHDNLVVGDVKQAIYRWRNGDWELLANQINDDFPPQQIISLPLSTNWRSRRNIVGFNNICFKYSASILEDQFQEHCNSSDNHKDDLVHFEGMIGKAYSDLEQQVPSRDNQNGGYVNITFLEDSKENSWEEEVLKRLPKLIEQLQDQGYNLKDIAILVRKKDEGQKVVNTLLEYKNSVDLQSKYRYDVVSNESLFLKSSSGVNLLVAVLRYFNTPDDYLNRAFLLNEYCSYIKVGDISDHSEIFNASERESILKQTLPAEFWAEELSLRHRSLFEQVERIIALFRLNEHTDELPFIQAFEDEVLNFVKRYSGNAHAFLEWWDENAGSKTVPVSENQDAIRILTIHKSKGLEFKVVIVPFCNWMIDNDPRKTNIIWCHPHAEPFDQIPVLPLKYSSKLAESIFYKDYFEEQMHAYIDNLNLMYVAFTRPEDMLFVFSKKPKEKDKAKEDKTDVDTTGSLLFESFGEISGSEGPDANILKWNGETGILEAGSFFSKPGTTNKSEEGQHSDILLTAYPSVEISGRLKLKLHSDSYFEWNGTQNTKINYGKLMHEVFQHIITTKDIDNTLKNMVFEGKLSVTESNGLKIKIDSLFTDPLVKSWFDGQWKVKTEADILLKNDGFDEQGPILWKEQKKMIRRPDRVLIKDKEAVVIDYKFGDLEKSSYLNQIRQYAAYLAQMGYSPVKAYIWYVNRNKVVAA